MTTYDITASEVRRSIDASHINPPTVAPYTNMVNFNPY